MRAVLGSVFVAISTLKSGLENGKLTVKVRGLLNCNLKRDANVWESDEGLRNVLTFWGVEVALRKDCCFVEEKKRKIDGIAG